MSSKIKKKSNETDDESNRIDNNHDIHNMYESYFYNDFGEENKDSLLEIENEEHIFEKYEQNLNLYNFIIEELKSYTEQLSLPLIENINTDYIEKFLVNATKT